MAKHQVGLSINTGSSLSQLKMLDRQVNRTAIGITNLGKTTKATSISILSSLTTMVVAAAPLVNVVKSFAQYRDGLRKINTVAGMSETTLDELGNTILKTSINFGKSASDVQDAMFNIVQTQRFGAKAIEVLNAAGVLAVGGMTSLRNAVSLTTTVLDSYGKKIGKASDVTNKLFAIQTFGKITIDQLDKNLGKVASTASIVGIKFDEVGAAIATMTRMGHLPAITMTGLNTLFSKLIDPASKVSAIFRDEFGNSALALKKVGLKGVIKGIMDSTGGLSYKIRELGFSIRTFRAIAALASKEGFAMFTDLTSKIAGAKGFDVKAMEEAMRSPMFLFRQIGTAIKELSITLGSTLGKEIKSVSLLVKNSLPGIIAFVKNNKTFISTIIKLTTVFITLKTTGLLVKSVFLLLSSSMINTLVSAKNLIVGFYRFSNSFLFATVGITNLISKIRVLDRYLRLLQARSVATGFAFGSVIGLINSMGAKGIKESFVNGNKFLSVMKGIGAAASIVGTAIMGWEIGKKISEITGLKGVLEEIYGKFLKDDKNISKGETAAKKIAKIVEINNLLNKKDLKGLKDKQAALVKLIDLNSTYIRQSGLGIIRSDESFQKFKKRAYAFHSANFSKTAKESIKRVGIDKFLKSAAVPSALKQEILLNKKLFDLRRKLLRVNKGIRDIHLGIMSKAEAFLISDINKVQEQFAEKRFTSLQKITKLNKTILFLNNDVTKAIKNKNKLSATDLQYLKEQVVQLEQYKLDRWNLLAPLKEAYNTAKKSFELSKLSNNSQILAESKILQSLNLRHNLGILSIEEETKRFKLLEKEQNIHKSFLDRKRTFEMSGMSNQQKINKLTKERIKLMEQLRKAHTRGGKEAIGIQILDIQSQIDTLNKMSQTTKATPMLSLMREGSVEAATAIQRARSTVENKIEKNTGQTNKVLKSIEKEIKKTNKTSNINGSTTQIHFV